MKQKFKDIKGKKGLTSYTRIAYANTCNNCLMHAGSILRGLLM